MHELGLLNKKHERVTGEHTGGVNRCPSGGGRGGWPLTHRTRCRGRQTERPDGKARGLEAGDLGWVPAPLVTWLSALGRDRDCRWKTREHLPP